jgi:hypothetical protein
LPALQTKMADTNNHNVDPLEKFIRSTAELTLRLNIISAIFALMGFGALLRVYLYEPRNEGNGHGNGQRDSE